MLTLKTTVFFSTILVISKSISVFAQEHSPNDISPATEIQLSHVTPAIRDIVIVLKGTEKEATHLATIQQLINDILATAKPKVIRVPVTQTPLPVSKQTETTTILLHLQPMENASSYQLNVTLQQEGTAEEIGEASFDYTPTHLEILRRPLKTFLFEKLNLESTNQVTFSESIPIEPPSPSEEIVTSPEEEIQLKNLTPPVQDIVIKLQGTEKEQAVLQTIHTMVSEILNNARIAVMRVPTTESPIVTPILRIYKHLEIIIAAQSTASETSYKIKVILQEKGAEKGEFKTFDYFPNQSQDFYQQLRTYLFKHMHLQPK